MLTQKIRELIKNSLGTDNFQVEISDKEEFGDYTTNVAIVEFAKQKKSQEGKVEGAREIAEKFVETFRTNGELSQIVEKIEVAGPGFINFFLSKNYLLSELRKSSNEKQSFQGVKIGEKKTVLVEYSSPNIAKRFGIGHIRSTIIGQAIYNLYSYIGFKVVGDNHLGDWGTQFGTLLYEIHSKGLEARNLSIDELENLYVEFNEKANEEQELWNEARRWFKKLERGDSWAREVWRDLVEISLAEFRRIYDLLGVKIDYSYGESFYEDKIEQVVGEVRSKGLSKKSEGAEIVEFPDMPPAMLLKSDRTTTYFTRDLATIKFRIENWNPEKIIYEVGADQILHFKQVFETAKLLGWTEHREFVHIPHGLIRFEHGKMSTRKGQTVKLEEVLEEGIRRARMIVERSETQRGLASEEKEKIIRQVGIGAIKYFDLSHEPTSDIVFDWDKIFVLEGNSGPYLQYTYARIKSVLAKSSISYPKEERDTFDDTEIKIIRKLVKFPDIVERAASLYSPNLLCNFLFELAQKYNSFYNGTRILGSEREESLLLLSRGVGNIIKTGLTLLGIETPEKM